MNKKKIIFLVPTLNKGGAERVVSILSNFLSEKYLVTIISLSSEPSQYDIKSQLITLKVAANKKIIMKLLNVFKRLVSIRKVVKEEQPDLIISFMESANIPVILATRFLNWKGSLTVSVRNNPSMFPWYYRALIKLLYGFPQNVVAPSLGIKKDLEKMVFNHHGIDFIPNPIDLNLIKNESRKQIDDQLKLPDRYVLAVGRLTHQKGFDRLISIFSKLKYTNLFLVILGEGELRNDLNALINSYELKGRVLMPGLIDNPFPVYRHAICLALTSRYEGWPNVINESIASSCPVVSYDCKYGPNEILDHDNGFLIEEDDEEGFINAISALYEKKELRDLHIDNGLKNVEQYSIEKISDRWLRNSGLVK